MKKPKHTTVLLTEKAQAVKVELTPIFGLKNILSAGLILLGRLSSDQQKKSVSEANGLDYPCLSGIQAYRYKLFTTRFDKKSVAKQKQNALRKKYQEDENLSIEDKKLLDDLLLMFLHLPEDKRAGLWKDPAESG